MDTVFSLLKTIDLWVSRITRFICIVSMMIVFGIFIINVFLRFMPIYNFTETDEWTQLFLVWVIFFGAQELVRTRSHFIVDVLTDRIKGTPLGKVCRILSTVIEFIMYAVICWHGWVLVGRSQAYMQTIDWLQMKYFYAVIPISAFFMSCYALRDTYEAVRLPWKSEG